MQQDYRRGRNRTKARADVRFKAEVTAAAPPRRRGGGRVATGRPRGRPSRRGEGGGGRQVPGRLIRRRKQAACRAPAPADRRVSREATRKNEGEGAPRFTIRARLLHCAPDEKPKLGSIGGAGIIELGDAGIASMPGFVRLWFSNLGQRSMSTCSLRSQS